MSDETSDKGPGDRRAHRPDPRYVEGDLVRVVQAMNQAEAELERTAASWPCMLRTCHSDSGRLGPVGPWLMKDRFGSESRSWPWCELRGLHRTA